MVEISPATCRGLVFPGLVFSRSLVFTPQTAAGMGEEGRDAQVHLLKYSDVIDGKSGWSITQPRALTFVLGIFLLCRQH